MTIVWAIGSRRGVPVAVSGMLLIGALAGDIAWHDYTQRNTRQLAADWQPAAKAFPAPPATARFLLARRAVEGPSRFVWLTDRTTRVHQLRYGRAEPEQELLLNMAATRYGLDDVSGYDPVHLNSFSAYLRRSNEYVGLDRHFEWVRVPETPKLHRLGVRYYVAQPGQQPAEPARRLPQPARGHRRGSRRAAARAPEPEDGRHRAGEDHRAPARPRRDRHAEVGPRAPGARRPRLSGLEGDGRRPLGATSLVSRGIFRAVDLPAGAHRVVWTFDPPRLRIGAFISVGALLAAARRRRAAVAAAPPRPGESAEER